ncbi:tautomerase family protein [Vallitalea okinawensis]|uniref:tautomerase family protein n=1 Tax=Vallitalea okinawensis TaxID=2078660 RepID=UPI000CFB0063|nr:tautomerase family protein [Vallitalea okinawensis]
MPHALIKLWTGRSEEQKKLLALRISQVIAETANVEEECISIAIQDIEKDVWYEQVYSKDIIEYQDILYKKPGYGPLSDI